MVDRGLTQAPTLAIVLIVLAVSAAAVGTATAFNPTSAVIAAGALAGATCLWLLIRHFVPAVDAANGALLIQLGFFALMVSMIRIFQRDPTSSELGLQAIFEFALQAGAGGLLILGLLVSRGKVSLSPALIMWSAFGAFAMMSALWAPQPELSALKGLQLIAVCALASLAAYQFRNRYDAIRFLAWLTLIVLVGGFLYQMGTEGLGSLWELTRGRFRLNLLSVHPLILGGFSGAVALLLLVNRPRRVDWIAFALLAAIPALTSARAPLLIMVCIILCYAMLRGNAAMRMRLVLTVGISILIVGFVLSLLSESPGDVESSASLTFGDLERDIGTLNGRIPLWQAALERADSEASSDLSLLLGYGYASFRHFGTSQFSYAGDAHNSAIQVITELGAVGAILWVFAVGACIRQVWRSESDPRMKLTAILPIAYIMMIQMLDASLADSRSFLIVVLLFYSHAGWRSYQERGNSSEEPDVSPDERADRQRRLVTP